MDDLNVRIAKALGWEYLEVYDDIIDRRFMNWVDATGRGQCEDLPEWDRDLNLMHELEGEMKGDSQWWDYCYVLKKLVTGGGVDDQGHLAIHATAAQRAEAWLMVKEGSAKSTGGNDEKRTI